MNIFLRVGRRSIFNTYSIVWMVYNMCLIFCVCFILHALKKERNERDFYREWEEHLYFIHDLYFVRFTS